MENRRLLWSPPKERINASNIKKYCNFLGKTEGVHKSPEGQQLYQWSIENPSQFWKSLWDYFGIVHTQNYSEVLEHAERMPGALWFSGATLNFAENLLRYQDDRCALRWWGESNYRQEVSYRQLYAQVTSLAEQLRKLGIKSGDRVAAVISNSPEAIIGMLATTAIGAIWSSCSPDFGVNGIVDRFGQISPRILIATSAYLFKGKTVDCREKISAALAEMPSVEHLISIDYAATDSNTPHFKSVYRFSELVTSPPAHFEFTQLPSQHPVYIMYSSGTTGKPKCIVHGAIGTLIEQRKELELHCDLKRDDIFFYQTTCGWMMWNWLAAGLAAGATLVLFDGSPLHEDNRIIFRLVDEERVSIFGTNAKFLSLTEKSGVKPNTEYPFKNLRTILSTGSVLAPESFDYVYRDIKADVLLSSISGGTDILGCFALGSPTLPVIRGALQTRSLGLAVEVFDQNGKSVRNQQGELVCTKPFPSMPVYFWNDDTSEKYHKAYFEKYPGVWTHGDYTELLETGAMVFHGRSDTTLNPGGVRIGTAEIYQQVEKFPAIVESLVVAYRRGTDEKIVLFVVLNQTHTLTPELESEIRTVIRTNLSPFHVPHAIFAVLDLPRTRSGKIVEGIIRDILHDKKTENIEALANPESLNIFRQIALTLNGAPI